MWEREVVGRLLEWWRSNRRVFPWRSVRSPWLVLLAGVLLRKTGAKAVSQVYPKLAAKYRSPVEVLRAGAKELERDLKPLGMYRRRAKELVELAEVLCSMYGGRVPRAREELVRLPGVGDYIASVVLCYAYGEATPTIDTNTRRLISRLAGVDEPQVREVYERLLKEAKSSRELNLAMLDFAALVCRARGPRCGSCPLAGLCSARLP
ncbi:MAG: hypothetical protein DRN96_04730 [Thermoproteota archaeon]|nr:MAG: hypothetical protein DRN96_04730 [Candidatus Korarchaeota archaeon]RLG53862.1 MAG: hypothetical protein DRN99_06085 [Candidatus Korarchaeota archaeon]